MPPRLSTAKGRAARRYGRDYHRPWLGKVVDTIMTPRDQAVHVAEVTTGVLRTGDRAEAVVDKGRRSNTCRNHTATHILHQALREILGEHVRQAGSLVSAERLRFDFNHLNPLTPSQLQAVEQRVNEIIWENVPVTAVVTDREKAEMGALALFRRKIRRCGACRPGR